MRRARPKVSRPRPTVARLGSKFSLEDMKKFADGRLQPSKVRVDKHGYEIGRKTRNQRRDVLVKRGKKVDYYVWGNKIAHYNDKSKKVSISSAGWETNLTKDRLNRVIPKGYIVQEKFVWKIQTPKGKKIPFKDVMSFNTKVKRKKRQRQTSKEYVVDGDSMMTNVLTKR